MAQTAKEQYDELVNSLKDGSHTYDGRDVLAWDEYDGDAGAQAGKRVVAVQYAGVAGGGGGVLRDYAFDPAALAEQPAEPAPEEKTAPAAKSPKQS